jgi:hypothetical protein
MRIVLAVLAAAVLATAIVLATREGSSDSGSADRAVEEVQLQTAGAYGCMPPGVRRQFDRASKRYNARFEQIVDRLPDDASGAAADRALRSDREFVLLANRTKRILVRYLPGGDRHDPDCYARAIKRYERRIADRQ